MNNRAYLLLSGTIFSLVALAHLARAVESWPVQVAGWAVPVTVSWLGFVATSALAIWAFSLVRGSRILS